MTTAVGPQQYTFQAEISRLLELLAHSLYQSKEIALRELVSNASDALDKIRFIGLTDEKHRPTENLEIVLTVGDDKKTLTIADNGVGMTREELVNNLGTIARSGSLDFLKQMTGDARRDVNLIGQFGVGFYSAFMVANKVEVISRSYLAPETWKWSSDGAGAFAIEETDLMPRGTKVVLHLKDDAADFANESRLKEILKKYSGFIAYPIKVGATVANDVRPIWVEPKNQVTDEQYVGFYQHLTHHSTEKPLWWVHASVDSPIQFHAILYCPPTNPELLGFGRLEHGLHLCARRVLVQDDCRDLLPEYLRFLVGTVDSEDLPLNISRETLQDHTVFRKIRQTLVRRVLERIERLSSENPEEYKTFYKLFGVHLKEGIASHVEERKRLADLLRFASSHAESTDALTTLKEYLARAPVDQTQIYYLGGVDAASIRRNPNLEIFRKRGLEVLFLTDPIDEFVMAALFEYEGKELKSIDSPDIKFPESTDSKIVEVSSAETKAGIAKVIDLFKRALGADVADVRESKRLTDSPACLTSAEGGLSPRMEKLLRMANRDMPPTRRVLEINPHSQLIERLAVLSGNPANDQFIQDCGRQLFANSLLLEGTVHDPQDAVARIEELMKESANARTTIVT